MPTFTVLFYILETIFYSVTLGSESRVFFLHQKGLKKHNESDIAKLKGLTSDKLVIYISKTRFVNRLTLHTSCKFEDIEICNICVSKPYFLLDESVNETMRVSSYYKDETSCDFRGNPEKNHSVYGCQQISRILIINTIIGFSGMEIVGYGEPLYSDTFIENYIGCFTATTTLPHTLLNNLEECESSCRNGRYFGMKSRNQCFCTENLDLFSTEILSQCTMSCRARRYQICGGKEFISFYVKDDFIGTKQYHFPTWECVYNQTNCTICPAGRIGLNCELIDCSSNNGGCEDHICQHFLWSSEVVALCSCQKGFILDRYETCKDIDECSLGHICDLTTANCINNAGSYECVCHIGYEELLSTEESFQCTDIDECANEKACQHDSFTYCVNLPGSFKCYCRDGFRRNERNICEDIDECSLRHICDLTASNCINTEGSYKCMCHIGYRILLSTEETFQCTDIDECTNEKACQHDNFTYCINLPGSFKCNCRYGFRRLEKYICEDIDECNELLHNCGKMAICIDKVGSYECVCPPGLIRISYTYLVECQDRDECIGANVCNKTSSICLNILGSYVCQCLTGYINIDSHTCEKSPIVQTNQTPEFESFTWTTQITTENPMSDLNTLLLLLFGLAGILTCLLICCCFIFYYRRKQRTFDSGTLSTVTAQSGIMKL